MKRTLTIAALAAALYAGPALAQANRTFVSGSGSDSNPCSLAAPCRSFAQAITQTNAGGEIAVLDTAGYGTVTITKPISIVAPDGIEAGVTTSVSGPGIVVNAGFGDIVTLRGLTLTGGGVGSYGITFGSGTALLIDHCTIRGFNIAGIGMFAVGPATLQVSDTILFNDGEHGIQVAPTGNATETITLARVQSTGNQNGITLIPASGTNHLTATIADSFLTNNGTAINAAAVSPTSVSVMVDNSRLVANVTAAMNIGTAALLWLGRSTVWANGAFNTGSAQGFISFGNNQVDGNPQINPTITNNKESLF